MQEITELNQSHEKEMKSEKEKIEVRVRTQLKHEQAKEIESAC